MEFLFIKILFFFYIVIIIVGIIIINVIVNGNKCSQHIDIKSVYLYLGNEALIHIK